MSVVKSIRLIYVNAKPIEWPHDTICYSDVCELAHIHTTVNATCTLRDRTQVRGSRTLVVGDSVRAVTGLIFNVAVTDRA